MSSMNVFFLNEDNKTDQAPDIPGNRACCLSLSSNCCESENITKLPLMEAFRTCSYITLVCPCLPTQQLVATTSDFQVPKRKSFPETPFFPCPRFKAVPKESSGHTPAYLAAFPTWSHPQSLRPWAHVGFLWPSLFLSIPAQDGSALLSSTPDLCPSSFLLKVILKDTLSMAALEPVKNIFLTNKNGKSLNIIGSEG